MVTHHRVEVRPHLEVVRFAFVLMARLVSKVAVVVEAAVAAPVEPVAEVEVLAVLVD